MEIRSQSFIIIIIISLLLLPDVRFEVINTNYFDSDYVDSTYYENELYFDTISVDEIWSDFDKPSLYEELQKKWKLLYVPEAYNESNLAMVQYVENLSHEAKYLYQTLNKGNDKVTLWEIELGDQTSAHVSKQFEKILKLTIAYGTRGTIYYRNQNILTDIKESLNFMLKKGRYNGKEYQGNWWDWQIGSPQSFITIMMVIKEELTPLEIQTYTTAINGYVPDPFTQMIGRSDDSFVKLNFLTNFESSGTNRADLALIVLGLGILQENSTKIKQACESIGTLFETVTDGDGLYPDGSLIQHGQIPYTGSYGIALIRSLCAIIMITKGSIYEINVKIVEQFLQNVKKAFIPLIYKGNMLPMVNGRAATRPGYGITAIYNLLLLTKIASNLSKDTLREATKYWLNQNPTYYLENSNDFNDFSMTLSLLMDDSVSGNRLPFVGVKMYAAMDRFVQRTKNYMIGLALHSSRISSFEAGNKENKRGWHTADGMIYVYNDDDVQFNETYWPTVDPYRLPGTTVDTIPLQDEISPFLKSTSNEAWVGGASYADQAVVGMSLNKEYTKNNAKILPMNLRGKKSWFFVDGLIVALGAGISGDTTATIETVVENRLLNEHYAYKIRSDGGAISTSTDKSKKEWLLLKADHEHASIGYYFPNKENVEVWIEQRSGRYTDINECFPDNVLYTGKYAKFLINHGSNPRNASYEYVLLPDITEPELKSLLERKPLSILSNTADVQAVELREYNYIGINIWNSNGGEVAGIRVNRPVSLLVQTSGSNTSYTLSDPTQSNLVTTVILPKVFTAVLFKSNGIHCNLNDKTFTANFSGAIGSSKTIIVIH